MTTPPSVILIELNELCPSLMEKFIQAGHLPHFKRFYEESDVYVTDAEEEGENLNPWIQWVSVHSGMAASEHKVKTLSEGPLLKEKAIWDLLSDAGHRVWVCGSMNPRCDVPINGYLLPDPWSEGIEPQPVGEFDAFQNYIRSAVQEHSNETKKPKGKFTSFFWYMLKHGLSFMTFWATFKQLLSERFANTRWRRATIMDRFQWDMFLHYYKRDRPAFSTFFVNSTAHLQHCYWRHMEPEKFASQPAEKEQRQLKNAILYGYKCMDKMMKRFMKLAGSETTLMFSTALSQQPYVGHEETGGRHYYRLLNEKVLVERLGITQSFSYEPLMAEQFYLRFKSEEDAQAAEKQLCRFRIKDTRVFQDDHTRAFHLQRKGNAILAQCRCTTAVPQDVAITMDGSSTSISFSDVFYLLDTIKSGKHHPDGMLWIRNPSRKHMVHNEKVSIRAIAPVVLDLFNVPVPSYMNGGHTNSPVPMRKQLQLQE